MRLPRQRLLTSFPVGGLPRTPAPLGLKPATGVRIKGVARGVSVSVLLVELYAPTEAIPELIEFLVGDAIEPTEQR